MNEQAQLKVGDTLIKLAGDPEDPEVESVWQVLDVHTLADRGKVVTLTEMPAEDEETEDRGMH